MRPEEERRIVEKARDAALAGIRREIDGLRRLYVDNRADTIECPECGGRGWTCGIIGTHTCLACRAIGRIWPLRCDCGFEIGTDMVGVRLQENSTCPKCGNRLPYPYTTGA